MKEDMLIGEFSELTGVSKRMIRHFDGIGLLSPHYIDECNGYRFYSVDQIKKLRNIKYLQNFGFTLKEIQDILSRPLEIEEFLLKLKDQEAILRTETDKKVHQLLKLKSFISYVEDNPVNYMGIELNEFEIERSIPMNEYDMIKEEIQSLMSSELFFEKIEELREKTVGKEIYFISFDIDQFMSINDNFGYSVGDKVIFRLYHIIRSNFKQILEADQRNMLSRLGGDEFALLIIGSTREEITACVIKVLGEFENYDFSKDGCNKSVTSSCGISVTKNVNHPAHLRHNSIKALIEAKKSGRNQYKMM